MRFPDLKDTRVSPFERAADAIVNGNIEALRMLLRERPELVTERSEREHHSTLLHYVSANGVEENRQKTPANIVEITRLLLDAGADVNAESDAYRGRSTALELTATSCHPENAGVQIELMALLLERGARIDGARGESVVNYCLGNGRGEAATFLASRGAKLDIEGAAGVGRVDLMPGLLEGSTREQMLRGLGWACEFGHADVVVFLLDHGVHAADPIPPDEITGLHWAAYSGNSRIVKLLVERGASVTAKEKRFDGTPLDWALHGRAHPNPKAVIGRDHDEVVALLRDAGQNRTRG